MFLEKHDHRSINYNNNHDYVDVTYVKNNTRDGRYLLGLHFPAKHEIRVGTRILMPMPMLTCTWRTFTEVLMLMLMPLPLLFLIRLKFRTWKMRALRKTSFLYCTGVLYSRYVYTCNTYNTLLSFKTTTTRWRRAETKSVHCTLCTLYQPVQYVYLIYITYACMIVHSAVESDGRTFFNRHNRCLHMKENHPSFSLTRCMYLPMLVGTCYLATQRTTVHSYTHTHILRIVARTVFAGMGEM